VTPNPQTTANSVFFLAYHIFVMGERRDFKFGTQLNHGQFHTTDDEPYLKGTWLWSRDLCKFLVPSKITPEWLKINTSNFAYWYAV